MPPRALTVAALPSLCVALLLHTPAARAQVAGDSVRVWSRPPLPLADERATLLWRRADSLRLSTGYTLPTATVTRLQVRREDRRRSGARIVAGGVIGLGVGALVGYAAGAAFAASESSPSAGYAILVTVPAGAAVGLLVGGALGSRAQVRARWVDVPVTR